MPNSVLTLEKQASVFSKLYLYYIEKFQKSDELTTPAIFLSRHWWSDYIKPG